MMKSIARIKAGAGNVRGRLGLCCRKPDRMKVYANESIAQVIFFGRAEACQVWYKDWHGEYRVQCGVTLPGHEQERSAKIVIDITYYER